jgi:hypothetical protein
MTHRFDRGAAHTFICNGDTHWHIDQIINGIYFNCSLMLPDGRFRECTIICPGHKQAELACDDSSSQANGASNGGPPYSLEHYKTKRAVQSPSGDC